MLFAIRITHLTGRQVGNAHWPIDHYVVWKPSDFGAPIPTAGPVVGATLFDSADTAHAAAVKLMCVFEGVHVVVDEFRRLE